MAVGVTERSSPAGLGILRRPTVDTVTLLSFWLAWLYVISARQIVGPIGALGSPAMLIALPTLALWAAAWVLPRADISRDPHPMRPALLLYLVYSVASFGVAMSRSVTPLESSGAHRALLTQVAMTGIALLVADTITNHGRLDKLLRRVVIAVTFVSIVGIVEFFVGYKFEFTVPGLTWLRGSYTTTRSIFNRPSASTLHPIEFSVITAALLPLAIHYALYAKRLTERRHGWIYVTLIALATPLSISRSGLVALVVGLAVLVLAWNGRRRLQGLLVAAAAIPVLWATIPGLVGTLVSLFSNTDDDPSIQARINRGPRIMSHIRERPWFGLGNGTWSIEDYFLIDNEIWVTTLEMGIVGMVLTGVLLVFGSLLAIAVRELPSVDETTGHLAQAVAASIAALTVSLATFDAFHYRILTGTLFLLLGAAGALWRMHRPTAPFRR